MALTLASLADQLRREGVDPANYTLEGISSSVRARDGALFVGTQDGQWFVGGIDRGQHIVSTVLDAEGAACALALDRLTADQPAPLLWDDGDLEAACEIMQGGLAPVRASLQDGPSPTRLMAGQVVDRFGADYGRTLYPCGTPYPERSLPPDLLDPDRPALGLRVFVVQRHIDVVSSLVPPWFGQPGGAVLHRLQGTEDVAALIGQGALQPVALALT